MKTEIVIKELEHLLAEIKYKGATGEQFVDYYIGEKLSDISHALRGW